MKPLVIFGTGTFAELSHYYFTSDSAYTVVGFTVDGQYQRETTFKGLPVVAFEEVERHYPPSEFEMFVALGIRQVNGFRARKVDEAERKGYRLASYLSSRAVTPADLVLAPNCMVMEYAVVHPFAQIGRDTIVWPATGVTVHDRIGEHCWIVAANIGESVTIGDYTFVGIGTVIAPFVKVGKRNVLGAGSVIASDTKDSEVYRGPASRPSRVPSERAARLLE